MPQLSQRWKYCHLESNRNAGPIPMATGVGVMCSSGKGCIGPESSTAKYVVYCETTVQTYLHTFYLSPVWVTSSALPPLHQKG